MEFQDWLKLLSIGEWQDGEIWETKSKPSSCRAGLLNIVLVKNWIKSSDNLLCVVTQVDVRMSAQRALTCSIQRAARVTCPYLLRNPSWKRIHQTLRHLRRVPLLEGAMTAVGTVLNQPMNPATHHSQAVNPQLQWQPWKGDVCLVFFTLGGHVFVF